MADKVVSLHGGPLPAEPDPSVVACLEDLLEQARGGHIDSLAFAVTKSAGGADTGWAGNRVPYLALSGALTWLGIRFSMEMSAQSSSIPTG